jgi:uncharacterized protein involved in exopolysaccharide biosynthesis
MADMDREMAAKSAALTELRARQDRAASALRLEDAAFEVWSKRVTEVAAAGGSRTEQLRLVDPGIVPQRPSFPNVPLLMAVALLFSLMASVGFLSVRFSWEQRSRLSRAEPELTEIRMARSGNR